MEQAKIYYIRKRKLNVTKQQNDTKIIRFDYFTNKTYKIQNKT